MLTIGSALKNEIERYAREITRSNPLFCAARAGALTAAHAKTYVRGLHFQICGTMAVLQRAERRAAAIGDHPLADHYRKKLAEEAGHERWAEADLERLPSLARQGDGHDSRALTELVEYLDAAIDADPSLFLAYTLLAEYVTVLVGPAWLQELEHKCGIPQSMLSVVANHVELDREHVADGIREIDILVSSPDRMAAMLDVVRRSMSYYERFWSEILSIMTEAA